jgi:hypothetical protein
VIGPDQLARATARAVVPEQVIPYVRAVADGEPQSFGSCVGYVNGEHATIVGYPLHDPLDAAAAADAVEAALQTPVRTLSYIGASVPTRLPRTVNAIEDGYWCLKLPFAPPPSKLASLLRRAQRELIVDRARAFDAQHEALVQQYLDGRTLAAGTRAIYARLHSYVSGSPGSLVFSARRHDGRLAAFAIGEFASFSTAFFMFCFRDPACAPPGSADLVLSALIDEAAQRGQQRVNLGLGINPGVRFFKRKWRAEAMLPYVEVMWER